MSDANKVFNGMVLHCGLSRGSTDPFDREYTMQFAEMNGHVSHALAQICFLFVSCSVYGLLSLVSLCV